MVNSLKNGTILPDLAGASSCLGYQPEEDDARFVMMRIKVGNVKTGLAAPGWIILVVGFLVRIRQRRSIAVLPLPQ